MENFLLARENLEDYTETINTLIYSFVRQEEYISLSEKERNKIIDCCVELKCLIDNAIKAKAEREEQSKQIPERKP